MSLTALAIVFVLLVAVAAVVSALETGLFALKEHQVGLIAGENDRFRQRLGRLFERKDAFVNQTLLLSAFLNLGVAASGLALHRRLADQFDLPRFPLALALIVAIILLADVFPKLLSLGRPRGVFKLTSGIMLALHPIIAPISNGLAWLSDKITSRLATASVKKPSDVKEDELETLVEMRKDEGSLEDLEGEMIREIIKLRSKTAKDCMTPRVEVGVLADDLGDREADRAIREQIHKRIPVYHETPDEIVGVLDVAAYLQSPSPEPRYRDHIRPPVFAPETMPAIDMFESYLQEPRSLVIVLDEFGGFEGIVTQTDMVEIIVGDAAPDAETPQEILHIGRGTLLVTGTARLDDIGEELETDLEEEGLDTIGGLIFTKLGEVPERGETITLGDIVATVRKSNSKRIEELLLSTTNRRNAPEKL